MYTKHTLLKPVICNADMTDDDDVSDCSQNMLWGQAILRPTVYFGLYQTCETLTTSNSIEQSIKKERNVDANEIITSEGLLINGLKMPNHMSTSTCTILPTKKPNLSTQQWISFEILMRNQVTSHKMAWIPDIFVCQVYWCLHYLDANLWSKHVIC